MYTVVMVLAQVMAILLVLFVASPEGRRLESCVDHPAGLHRIIRAVDGDTVVLEALYLPEPLEPSLRLRIQGVDCPETHTAKCREERVRGEAAWRFTQHILEKHPDS